MKVSIYNQKKINGGVKLSLDGEFVSVKKVEYLSDGTLRIYRESGHSIYMAAELKKESYSHIEVSEEVE